MSRQSKGGALSEPKYCWIPLRTRFDKTHQYKRAVKRQKYLFALLTGALNSQQHRFAEGALDPVRAVVLAVPSLRKKYRHTARTVPLESLLQDNKHTIQKYYPDYTHIRVAINFGNNANVANNIWSTIQTSHRKYDYNRLAD